MGECIFLGRAPWIFFDASSQSEWRGEVYAVRSDLVGTMAPVLITVDRAGWFPAGFRGFLWAPDGTMAVVPAVNGSFASDAFLWRPGRGLPDPAVPLVEDEPRADFQALSWSPSSRALAYVRHDGRLDFIEISPVGELVRSKIDTAERVIDVWVKNDNELVYTTLDFMTSLATLVLATRSDGTWSTYPLGSTTSFDRYHSPDLTFVDFITRNQMTGLSTYWVVETKNGSEPIAVTDPAQDVGISWSPDGSQFIVAATDATNATALHAGPVSNLSSPPLLKQDLGLRATRADSERGWAPDSSRAALFQKGTFDRQLAMYEVGQGEQWHPLPRQGCESHVWSPNSKLLAIHTRSAADAKPTLTLVESPGYALRDIATAPLEAATSVDWGVPRFSADSGFLVYQVVAKKFYIDLRSGLEAAADPIELPGGIDGRHSFSTSGAGLVYVKDDKDCVYLNLSSKTPSTAIRVNDMGAVQDCGFQPLLP
jgi:hypothetical protein